MGEPTCPTCPLCRKRIDERQPAVEMNGGFFDLSIGMFVLDVTIMPTSYVHLRCLAESLRKISKPG